MKMISVCSILISIILFSQTSVYSQRLIHQEQVFDTNEESKWINIGKLGSKYDTYIMNEYEGKSLHKLRIWIKLFFEEDKINNTTYFDIDKRLLLNIDCEINTYQILGVHSYSSNGTMVENTYVENPIWIEPEKVGGFKKVILKICEYLRVN